jgi:RNA polymerase sigma-70 factor, ECF subfamily
MPRSDATVHPRDPAGEAIPRLLEKYGDRIYALGLRLCGGPAEAEDLVQQTFLNAFRRWGQFEGRAEPSTWLYTIAARACQRQKRRRSGEPARMEALDELLPGGEGGGALPAGFPPVEGDPYQERVRAEAREIVERAVARLPLEFRLPLVLKEIAELPLADVAEILGLKEETAKTRVHRARLKLRKELETILPAPPEPAHPRQVCLDLLRAKQEAMDRGVRFPLPQGEICERCQAVFASLDLARDACLQIGQGEMPPRLKAMVLAEVGGRGA